MEKIHKQIYTIGVMELGDRFYFFEDSKREVWEVVDTGIATHELKTKVFSQYSNKKVVYLRSNKV